MKRLLYLLIVILALSLTSCSGAPERNLASEACLIRKGLSTRTEVYQLLGPPDKIARGPSGTEDWYYYHVNKSTLKKVPLLGEKLGEEEIEILKISFRGDKAVDCIYLVRRKK
ncbi:MAG: outer membrane protein assembly factor BamE [Thermodesulfobacteria bacterium]|nr:outer membrane protein assembly factor BamE [Thermodesulfobacteriota bacterium]